MKNEELYGHWEVLEDFDIHDHFGFVYLITNKASNRKYIGQKQFWFAIKRPPLKGRVNKRHDTKESDWKYYTGSSNELNQDIEVMGKDLFKFEILELHGSKWDLSYAENKKIVMEDALPRNDYYNQFLGKIGKVPNTRKY